MRVGNYELKEELRYDKNNNWISIEGNIAIFGISEPGVRQARDIAFVELPKPGQKVSIGSPCGQIESAKWAGEIVAPVSGTITKINEALADDPSIMNSSPYADGWIAEIEMSDPSEAKKLMDADAAAKWIKDEIEKR